MKKRLSRFGVGPKIVLSVLVYGAAAGLATRTWPDVCLFRSVPYAVFWVPGAVLLAAAFPFWLCSVVCVMKAYNSDRLYTSGTFALCRHPMYSAAILLIIPGIALLTRSWPVMLTPLVAYAVFKRLIHVEDEYLEERFGPAYADYRARVRELVPMPRQ
jgi:protein-S-isoprenylcysteine O-methyltransferase Ste14